MHQGSMFRGGPLWPDFDRQVLARTCAGVWPRPRDERPLDGGERPEDADSGIWCGPIAYHYGHMIADFSMRIAASAHTDGSLPLVFSNFAVDTLEPPPAFWEMIDHLKIERSRVLVVQRPTRFRTLHVFPQAERRAGGWPSGTHLDFMDGVLGDVRTRAKDIDILYVSRAEYHRRMDTVSGRIAGEAYLEAALARAGVQVVHPETLNLAQQVDLYGRAKTLIFSEGSALHTLQLLGRIGARLIVVSRRRWRWPAAASLLPRVQSLRYLDAIQGLAYVLDRNGRPYRARAVAVLRPDRLRAKLRRIGIDLDANWDAGEFEACRDQDIAEWASAMMALNLHPGGQAAAEACLRSLQLDPRLAGASGVTALDPPRPA
jgi:hypothetical protein